jgi:hypothetical protein
MTKGSRYNSYSEKYTPNRRVASGFACSLTGHRIGVDGALALSEVLKRNATVHTV